MVVLFSGLFLQSCNFGDDDTSAPSPNTGDAQLEPGEYMTFDQLQARKEAAISEYTWPANYYPDLQGQYADASREIKESRFQQGFEYAGLGSSNECAWALAWVDARQSDDAAAEAEALDAMTNLLPNNPGGTADQSVIQWMTDMAAKASLGDPTMVNQTIAANCTDVKWIPVS